MELEGKLTEIDEAIKECVTDQAVLPSILKTEDFCPL